MDMMNMVQTLPKPLQFSASADAELAKLLRNSLERYAPAGCKEDLSALQMALNEYADKGWPVAVHVLSSIGAHSDVPKDYMLAGDDRTYFMPTVSESREDKIIVYVTHASA